MVVVGFSPAASRSAWSCALSVVSASFFSRRSTFLPAAAAAILSSVLASSSARWSARLLTLAGSRGGRASADRLVPASRPPRRRARPRRAGVWACGAAASLRVAGQGDGPGDAETEDGDGERGGSVLEPAAPVVADVFEERSPGVVARAVGDGLGTDHLVRRAGPAARPAAVSWGFRGWGPGRHQGGVASGPSQNHNGTVTSSQTSAYHC